MANRPFTMNIRHVNIMVKTCNKFKFKNSKYFQFSYFQLFQYTIMRQTKVFKLEFVMCFTILSPLYFGLSRHLRNHEYRALEAHFSL